MKYKITGNYELYNKYDTTFYLLSICDEEVPWKIIQLYFKGQHLTQCIRHQLESYNHFVNYQIQKTIDMFNPVVIHSDHDYNKDVNNIRIRISYYPLKIFIFIDHKYMKIMEQQNYVSSRSTA